MGLFDKKKTVPAWAAFFTEKEYTTYIDALDYYFRKTLNISYEIHDGVVVIEENDHIPGNLGLLNLAQICKQNRIEEYPQVISWHFNTMIKAKKFQNEFEKIEKDFDKVKQYIAVRLYDNEYIASVGEDYFILKQFAGKLFAALVFDFPHAITNIRPEQIKPWSKTADELFEIGLGNVRRNYATNVGAVEFGPEKDTIYAYEAEHLFATNVLLELDMYDGLIGKGGSLIAAPNRNIALIYPINDLKVVNMINNMCIAVPKLYDNNPGSLTKEIFWYKDGEFMSLHYDFKNNKISFSPPEEFVELLNNLAEPKA